MQPSNGSTGHRRSRQEYIQLVDNLIGEGQAIQRGIQTRVVDDDVYGDAADLGLSMLREEKVVDRSRFVVWQSNWATLLAELFPQAHPQRARVDSLCNCSADPSILEEMVALLVAMRQSLENGLVSVPEASPKSLTFSAEVFESLADAELKERCSDILKGPAKFDRAVNQATLVLEDRIRNRSGLGKTWIGTGLVNKALNGDPEKTILMISDDKDEHEGLCHICRGIMQAFRNPTHHYVTSKYTREEAIAVCAFIDTLLTAIGGARVVKLPECHE